MKEIQRGVFAFGMVLFLSLFFSSPSFSQISDLELVTQPPIPANIVGSIYAEGTPSLSIESVKSWGSYLYLAVRYINGDQKLEIWDVRDPSQPVKTDSLDYGNIIDVSTDHWKFPSVNVFDDAIVVRSYRKDYVYHHNLEGQFILAGVHDFAASAGEIINNLESFAMSSAASYGTYFGCLYEPGQVSPEEEYGYRILNFTNPIRPFVATLAPPRNTDVIVQEFGGHLTGSLGNMPAVVNTLDNQISVFSRKVQADSFIDVFWAPRFSRIFNSDALDRSVRSQIDQLVRRQNLTGQFADALERSFLDLQIEAELTLDQAIQAGFNLDAPLSDLLEAYDIDLDQNLRAAVEKIVDHHLSLELEKQFSQEFFSPVLSDWLDDLFNIPSFSTPEDLKHAVSDIVNDGLSAETVARFILDRYIAPYVDAPDWMYWTMDDVIDGIVDTPAGDLITAALASANETVNHADFLETALGLIPEAEQFYLPAGFPEDCRDVLEYAFYEHGAKLNPEGLAFMELLKFYQYYQGNDDYLNFESEFADAIRELQDQLSGAFVETVEPFLSSLSFVGDVYERISSFSCGISSRSAITLAIRDAVLLRLQAQGIDVDLPLRETLKNYELYADIIDVAVNPNAHLSSVEDLLNALRDDLHESQTQIQALWNEGVSHIEHLENACRKALAETLNEAWGDIDLDQTMNSALRGFIGNHVDYRWTFGANMDDLLLDYIHSCLGEYPVFIDNLSLLERAADGDVIARWQMTFQLAAAAAASNPVTLDQAVEYELVEKTLDNVYKQALSKMTQTILSDFSWIIMRDMFGSFSAWATRTEEIDFSFNAEDIVSLTPVRNQAFTWRNQVILLSREEWDFIHPRRISLALFDPYFPMETKKEILLDDWENVDYIHFHHGNILIGGSKFDGMFVNPTGMLLSLEKDRIVANELHELGVSAAEGMLGVNHDAHLVFYGPSGIFITTNPRTIAPSEEESHSDVASWLNY